MHNRVKTIIGKTLLYLILVLFLLWTVIPVYIIVSNSFKPTLLIKESPPVFFFEPTLSHYAKVLGDNDFAKYFLNSLIVALATTVISVIGGALGAYGLVTSKSRWARAASNIMLLGKLVPAIAILIPFYAILKFVGLNGTYMGPILAHSSVNLPFVVWLMLSFMSDIPKELFESSYLDGATRMQTFWKIIFPMLMPAIGSAIILSMQFSWNELLYSLQLTNMNSYTLPVGIGRFVGAVSVDWGKSSAAAAITMLPIIIVGFFMQKYLVSGLTAGAVKE
jgi:ABC-type glycerol-3-phosphate transport system permease component